MTNKHTILVVDDEDALREVLNLELIKMGYDSDAAENGEVAIEAMKKKAYELVLLDISMPKMDGIEVLKFISREYPSTKVIMLTALGDLRHAIATKQLGAIDFIVKPFNYDEIMKKISLAFSETC